HAAEAVFRRQLGIAVPQQDSGGGICCGVIPAQSHTAAPAMVTKWRVPMTGHEDASRTVQPLALGRVTVPMPDDWPGRCQHRARYPPNATGVSQTRTASVSPPAAATAGERVSCTQRANTSTVTASASAGR